MANNRLSKINKLEKENKSIEFEIENLKEVIQTLNNQSNRIQIIDFKTYEIRKQLLERLATTHQSWIIF